VWAKRRAAARGIKRHGENALAADRTINARGNSGIALKHRRQKRKHQRRAAGIIMWTAAKSAMRKKKNGA
jgi:hypothetical protein